MAMQSRGPLAVTSHEPGRERTPAALSEPGAQLPFERMPLTVFLVERDPAVRDSLAVSLEAAGLLVHAYPSVRALLDGFEPVRPACLVLDLDLPEPDGSSLLDRLEAWGGLPTVVTTGRLAAARQDRHLPAPCRLLQKPFGDVELIAEIDRAVTRLAGGPPAGPGST